MRKKTRCSVRTPRSRCRYPIVFFDALRVKIRSDGVVKNQAVYCDKKSSESKEGTLSRGQTKSAASTLFKGSQSLRRLRLMAPRNKPTSE